MKNSLYSALKKHSQTGTYPLHMPGHKRNFGSALPYDIDITEIYGFDDLHSADGIIKECCLKAAEIYKSDSAYMLVNGSTCGILAAVSSVAHRGDKIIIARNCHKSVYNACMLSELDARYIYPPMSKSGICGSISPETVRAALTECPTAKAVVITSPTYEGVVSDISSIARECHSRKIPLIVDSAHGSHMRFCSFGKSGEPISSGADIVITSLHKTLPSLTQTALAFVNGELVNRKQFEKFLSVFETSSPSYVLMSSIDRCLDFLKVSEKSFANLEKNLSAFYKRADKLNNLKIVCSDPTFFSFDKSKIAISTANTNISGVELMKKLREDFRLELEMAYPTYALAMTTICDEPAVFKQLYSALEQIDKSLKPKTCTAFPSLPKPMKIRMTNAEIDSLPNIDLTKEQAASGKYISKHFVYAYPPGIPIVTPGEIIGLFEYDYMEMLKKSGVSFRSV